MFDVDPSLLFDRVRRYLTAEQVQLIMDAYRFAEKAHAGQFRRSGKPYISHPVDVAYILADLEQDDATVIAALLHDTIEDCGVTEAQIQTQFGDSVARLVVGVTKLNKLSFESREEAQAENYRKMLIAMAEDIRVIIIKLADRMHNMKTLKFMAEPKQKAIAQETLDIYAPLAHRLGMASIKWELEDLALFYLDSESFQKIKNLVSSKRHEREHYIDRLIIQVQEFLSSHSIQSDIYGRPKHFYSIYKKLLTGDTSFYELYDMLGIRIIVDEMQTCYAVLGLIHSLFTPVPGRFKDFIAVPKTNMYQSLHTTVLGPQGKPIEVQIRTLTMHKVAEFGIAAHWHYKEKSDKPSPDSDFVWLRQMVERQKESSSPKDFLQDLKTDLFADDVFVFTPKGDVKVLTFGATALDFAYSVHTQVGNTCVGAKVNGQMVPLHHSLSNGDQIEVLTSKNQKPNADWIKIAKLRHTKIKIRQWLKKQHHDGFIEEGKDKLDKLFLAEGYDFQTESQSDNFQDVLDRFHVKSKDYLFLAVAQGELSPKEIFRFSVKKPKSEAQFLPDMLSMKRGVGGHAAVRVMGESGIVVSFAKCCMPLPGDDIEGIVTFGKGVSVHRTDCSNILSLDESKRGRLVDVVWDHPGQLASVYPVTLLIEAFDRVGVLQEILHHFSEMKINISQLQTQADSSSGSMRSTVVADLLNKEQLSKLILDIRHIPDVFDVRRV